MDIDGPGLALIAKFEGWVPRVYKDVVGVATIGYGHALRPGDGFTASSTLTPDEGLALLHKDAGHVVDFLNAHLTVDIGQNAFDALVSFGFNVGTGPKGLGGSTLLRLVNAGDMDGAAKEFGKWVHGGGGVLPVLVRRRAEEAALFQLPDA